MYSETWGLDANSKHRMWHSPITDNRGRVLVDFLAQHGLLTVNEKDGPTYSGPTGESWIDITVTTTNSAHRIQNWRVSEESTYSDHNLVLFNLTIFTSNTKPNRAASNSTRKFATQVGNWNRFTRQVQQNNQHWTNLIDNATTKDLLDEHITVIWRKLGEINKECFPPFLPKLTYAPWWSPELNTLRKQVIALKRRTRRCKNLDLKKIVDTRFRALKNLYKSEIIKAKQESWRRFCTESSKTTPWKTYKTSKSGFARKPVPSSLTIQDGTVTTSEKETADALLQKFFPEDHTAQDSEQQRNIRDPCTISKRQR
jgi:hypothetical protein